MRFNFCFSLATALLAAGLPFAIPDAALGQAQTAPAAPVAPAVSAASVVTLPYTGDKAIGFDDTIAKFAEGAATVNVIVTLPQPAGLKTRKLTIDSGLKTHQAEVTALQSEVLSSLPASEFHATNRYDNIAAFAGAVTLEGYQRLLKDPRIASVEPVRIAKVHTGVAIPRIEGGYAEGQVLRTLYDGRFDQNPVYPEVYTKGVTIAIVDTGIDYEHWDLGGDGFNKTNSLPPRGANLKCIEGTVFINGPAGDDFVDKNGHGSECAGIAAGFIPGENSMWSIFPAMITDWPFAPYNIPGYYSYLYGPNYWNVTSKWKENPYRTLYSGGIAHQAALAGLKVSATGSANISDMISAWDWCVTYRDWEPLWPIRIISTSMGIPDLPFSDEATCSAYSPAFAAAATACESAGITVFCSSGNDGFPNPVNQNNPKVMGIAFPSCLPNVVSVGAVFNTAWRYIYANYTTGVDEVIYYSNSAPILDLLAPSELTGTTTLWTEEPADDKAPNYGEVKQMRNNYTYAFNGTSAACPYAAGLGAVLQAAHRKDYGYFMTPARVRDVLTKTGIPIADWRKAPTVTKPRINEIAAIDMTLHNYKVLTPLVVLNQETDGYEKYATDDYGASISYATTYMYKSFQRYHRNSNNRGGVPAHYVPSGVAPATFTGTPAIGVVPLTVTFTIDTSKAPGGFTRVDWDFNGDSVVDFNYFPPPPPRAPISYTYNTAGLYTVVASYYNGAALVFVDVASGYVAVNSASEDPRSPYFAIKNGGTGRFQFCGDLMTGHGGCAQSLCPAPTTPLVETQYADAQSFRSLGFDALFTPHRVKVNSKKEFSGGFSNNTGTLKSHIEKGDAFVVGIPVFQDFVDHNFGMYTHDLPQSNKVLLGYHAVCVIGFDDEMVQDAGLKEYKGAFLTANSWGNLWGTPAKLENTSDPKGYAWISYDFVKRYAIEAWSQKDYPNITQDSVQNGQWVLTQYVFNNKDFYAYTKDFVVHYTYAGTEFPFWPEYQVFGVLGDGLTITFLNGSQNDVLNITKRSGVLHPSSIASITTDGNFAKVYTEATIGSLTCGKGTLKSVTAKGCHIGTITSPEVLTVNETDNNSYTWPEISKYLGTTGLSGDVETLRNKVNTSIVETMPIPSYPVPFTHRLIVNLSGVQLHQINAPLAELTLTLSSKKYSPVGGPTFMAYASVGETTSALGVVTAPSIVANEIKSLTVNGGNFSPSLVRAHRIRKIVAKAQVFSLYMDQVAQARLKFADLYGGGAKGGTIESTMYDIDSIQMTGGAMTVSNIRCHSNIKKIACTLKQYYQNLGLGPFKTLKPTSGYLGAYNDPTTMTLVSGWPSTDAGVQLDPAQANIESVSGNLVVSARFIAGENSAGLPSGLGYAKTLATMSRSAVPKIASPLIPVIQGESWSRLPVNFKNGDHATFVQH